MARGRSVAAAFWLLLVGATVEARQAGELALLAPTGGETWSAGSLHHVVWKGDKLPAAAMVAIDWSGDGGKTWSPAGKVAVSAGKLLWKVPEKLTSEGMLRLSLAGGATVRSKAFSVTESKAKAYRWENVTMKAACLSPGRCSELQDTPSACAAASALASSSCALPV